MGSRTGSPSYHPRFLVAQLGARMHYAVPRILYGAGMLDRFYTDVCAAKGWPQVLNAVPGMLRPAGLRRLLGRVPNEVPPERITSFTGFGIEYAWRRSRARRREEITAAHLWAGRRFCELILRQGLRAADGVYCFNSAGLELLRAARDRGMLTVVEQTSAPVEAYDALLSLEYERFPHWEETYHDRFRVELAAREKREWETSDLILCASEYTVRSIGQTDGPVERCVVLPYGVDDRFSATERVGKCGCLRVLFVGRVGLGKGVQYALEAAKRLGRAIRIRMVGPISVSAQAQEELQKHVELVGPVPRSDILAHYSWGHVFLFPTLSDGFGLVQVEALAAGLPVITTPNAGSVVRDGIDGFIVPIRDAEAIAEKLELLAGDRERLAWMSRNARERARDFTVEKYGQRLLKVLVQARYRRQSIRAGSAALRA